MKRILSFALAAAMTLSLAGLRQHKRRELRREHLQRRHQHQL